MTAAERINEKCRNCNRMCMNSLTVISSVDEERWQKIMDAAVRKKYRKGSYLGSITFPVVKLK